MNHSNQGNGGLERWRLFAVYALVIGVVGFYAFKLFGYQVVEGAAYQAQANENRTTDISVPTQRGIIYDRNGFILARNVASYNVVITPADLPGDPSAGGDYTKINTDLDPGVQEVYRKLSELIDVPANNGEITEEIVKAFSPCQTDLGIAQIVYIADTIAPYDPMAVICNIDADLAMTIQARASATSGGRNPGGVCEGIPDRVINCDDSRFPGSCACWSGGLLRR